MKIWGTGGALPQQGFLCGWIRGAAGKHREKRRIIIFKLGVADKIINDEKGGVIMDIPTFEVVMRVLEDYEDDMDFELLKTEETTVMRNIEGADYKQGLELNEVICILPLL